MCGFMMELFEHALEQLAAVSLLIAMVQDAL